MFTTRYPRGERELISPFHRFSAHDTVTWFESRGVPLKRGSGWPNVPDNKLIGDNCEMSG